MTNEQDYMAPLRRKKHHQIWLGSLIVVFVILSALVSVLLFSHDDQTTGMLEPSSAISAQEQYKEFEEATVWTDPTVLETETPEETDALINPPQPVSAAQGILDSMSLDEKICQLFMVRPEALSQQTAVTKAEASLTTQLAQYPVGGIVLFQDNLINREQCIALISGCREASRIPLLIGVDEEGGTVSRLGINENMGVTKFPPMEEIGIGGTEEDAYEIGRTLGRQLRELGFNLDFAPVADIRSNPQNTVIGNRAFSSDPNKAAELVTACVKGFSLEDLISCVKHFPGHGDTMQDSHDEYASTDKTLDQLRQAEFLPFISGIKAGVPMVMVGHIAAPAVTGDKLPASLSHMIVSEILRKELKFQGVIVTDAMDMGAITAAYSPGQAAVMALQAGCDLILMPQDLEQAVSSVREAVDSGTLTIQRIDESVIRILELKSSYGLLNP